MAVINDPNIAGNIARVGMGAGMAWSPQHVVSGPLPVGAGGAYRLSMQSGTMAVSLGANAEIFQFRYVTAASRVCLVHGLSISAALNVAATTAVLAALRATIARAWTVAGSGGTRATMTGNNQKLRTTHATSEVNDIGISTTAALTAGTKTFDAQDFGGVAFSFGTGAITVAPNLNLVPKTNLLGDFLGGLAWPLVLANQEGFAIRNGANAFPAGATWTFGVDVAWSEVDAF
ncbi:MAG TPA: hypothetical protein VGR82_17615 [Methylomirabilota bacterium]|jgi:hypothetical protein|nr:hypothetical protein [Methylomirabilota bacterium]